jgi:hypothetical protein
VTRRTFIAIGLVTLVAVVVAIDRYWWLVRRALIRLRLQRPPANLLRNAGFMQCTNPGIPDYWGSPNAASLVDVDRVIQVDQHGPRESMRSIRLENPRQGFELIFQSYGGFVPEPQPYTFSIYLKSDTEPLDVALSIGWSESVAVTVDQQWRLYKMTYTPIGENRLRRAMPVSLKLREQGKLWLAGPQLEPGSEPTRFALALMDDHPLPSLPWDKDQNTFIAKGSTRPLEAEYSHDARGLQIDAQRRCLTRDGKPFLMSAVAISDPDAAQLADIAAHGFDSILIFVKPPESEATDAFFRTISTQFDEASSHGLGGLAILSLDRRKEFTELKRDALNTINALKHHRAIRGWMMLDEPAVWWGFESRIESQILELYHALKNADSSRPVFTNHNSWESGKGCYGGLQSTDLGCVDSYPIGQFQNPLKRIADLSSSMNTDCIEAAKPSAFWHQLYGYDDAVREPTVEEERAMTYLSIILGTRILFYWLYKPLNAELWESMKTLREELNKLEVVLLDDQTRWLCTGTSSRRVYYSVFGAEDIYYLLVCNASPDRVSCAFEIEQLASPRLSNVSRYFEGSGFDFVSGRLSMTFAPYERQMFELR